MKIFIYIDSIIDLKKSYLPKLLYFVTVSCFHLSPLIIFKECMPCFLIAHFIPFRKVELFETSMKSGRKND